MRRFFLTTALQTLFSDTTSLQCENTGSKNVHVARDNSAYQFTNAWSIGFWVYGDFSAAVNHYLGEVAGVFYFYYDGNNDRLASRVFNSSGNSFLQASGTNVSDNNWHLVIYTYDGVNTHKASLDGGTLVSMGTTFTHDQDADNSLKIAERSGFGVTTMDTDEWFVLDHEVSDAEAVTLYNAGKPIDVVAEHAANCPHWWRTEIGAGSNWGDGGTLTYNGTYQNSPTLTSNTP